MTGAPMKTPTRRPPGFPAADAVVARPAVEPAADPAATDAATAQTPPAAGRAPRDPYAGAGTKQVNTRLLEPLHTRYVQLVRQLEDEGYRTSLTELLHALMEEGPATPDDARELVRRWRRRREP
jgi:hypothetical protein